MYFRLFLFILLLPINNFAQSYLFDLDVIGIEDGLPDREVFDIIADKKGYLWISTQGAISRYDGHQFKTYSYQQLKIKEGQPASLALDDHNNIWYVEALSLEGNNHSGVINTSNDSIYTLEAYTEGAFNSKDLHNLNRSYENPYLWYITSLQGDIYEYKNGHFKKVYKTANLIKHRFHYEPTGDETNWVFHKNKAIRLQNNLPKDTFTFNQYHNHVKVLKVDSQQSTLIVASNNLGIERNQAYWQYKDDQFLPYQTADHLTHLEKDFNTYLTADSVIIKDDNQQIIFRQSNPLGHGSMDTYYLKKQQMLFLCTSNGILKITRRKNPFQLFYKGKSIRGLYQEKDYLWIGGERINIRTHLLVGEVDHLIPGQENNPFITFTRNFKDSENQWWIGTNANILVQGSPDTQQIIHNRHHVGELSIPFENIKTKKLWIGTSIGLLYFDKSTKTFVPIELPNTEINFIVRHFHQNEKGIWILTNQGILLMDANSETILKHYTIADGFPHTNFNHLYEDTDGIFWLASKGGGLIRWDMANNKIKQFTQTQGLSNNVLYAVYEDEYDNLWLPSNYGLMKFNKNTHNTRVYLPQNGIPHEEFNTFSHTQAADGTLYFGGLGGAVGFHPKDIYKNEANYSPPLYLTSVKVLADKANEFKEITTSYIKNKEIILAHNYQALDLELSLLDYESTKDNQYAYQIKGYQDQWVYSKENIISLFKIPYGTYQVKLKAKGASGKWTNELISFPLTIKAPFYLQSWFLIGLLALLICAIMLFIKRREIKLQKDKRHLEQEIKKRTETILTQTEKLKQLDQAKSRFFSNITHEFRTPLTLIIGPLQQMIKNPVQEATPKRLQNVKKNAEQILHLINQLLDISKLESGKMKLAIAHGNIIDYTKQLIDGFQDIAIQKNQDLIFYTKETEWKIHFDKDKWNKIIYNLVSNAIKFTSNGGTIQVNLAKRSKEGKEWVHLEIKDNGIGIPKNKLPQIFDRFYQADDSSTRQQEGTGIGLALVKELIELQKGEIEITSQVNLGTTVSIQIPIPKDINLNKIALDETEIIAKPIVDKLATPVESIKETVEEDQAFKILIIEDNRDMLNYIKSCFNEKLYSIYTSVNGEEGIQKAQTIIPDVIVSDVMMPIKDGFEVTQTIRENLATSHIPVILLTAKAALESKLMGLDQGADAYLTKPFSPDELRMRVLKLIENRLLLQNRYQNENTSASSTAKTYNRDREDAFISNLRTYIKNHTTDTNLNGETIGKAFGISRMQLHRKIKALTNQTTSSFINTVQLEMAYQLLLKDPSLNISEIAYQTGFKTPKHFSKLFKEKYGKTPSKIFKED